VYKPWTASIDEGWTRLVLDQFEFKYATLTDEQARAGRLRAQFDVIVLPSVSADRLATGLDDETVPPEYAGGLSQAGVDNLRAFVREGGTLVCLGASGGLAIDAFNLPLRDIARENERLFVPGSIVRLEVDPKQPLAFGLPAQTAAFFAFSSVFESAGDQRAAGQAGEPPASGGVRTVARYGREEVLLSGWLEGEEIMAGRAAVVDAPVGAGQIVLLGFPVQHRGQSLATFRLLFNALFASPQGAPNER
jgi:hypothetical protein